jgi:hypothetical protein
MVVYLTYLQYPTVLYHRSLCTIRYTKDGTIASSSMAIPTARERPPGRWMLLRQPRVNFRSLYLLRSTMSSFSIKNCTDMPRAFPI